LCPDEPVATVLERNSSPHPPLVAVVESPASSQYMGFSACLEMIAGAARARGRREKDVMRMMNVCDYF
jgi:hypothetical protein